MYWIVFLFVQLITGGSYKPAMLRYPAKEIDCMEVCACSHIVMCSYVIRNVAINDFRFLCVKASHLGRSPK